MRRPSPFGLLSASIRDGLFIVARRRHILVVRKKNFLSSAYEAIMRARHLLNLLVGLALCVANLVISQIQSGDLDKSE